MNPGQVNELASALSAGCLHNAHVAAKATEIVTGFERAKIWPVFSPEFETVVLAPHWLEVAIDHLAVAQRLFGDRPARLYSLNAFWTTPIGDYKDTHNWHRDDDDPAQLTLFMFGVDVPVREDGAFELQRGTHHIRDDQLSWDPIDDPPDRSTIETVTGPRGTLILCNTVALHRGLKPRAGVRLLLWARYSTADPPVSYHRDGLSPVSREKLGERYPEDPKIQEAIRWIAR